MQIIGVRERPTKYYCCNCGKRLSARAKSPEWRKIPADQKRCLRCASRHRGLLRFNKQSRLANAQSTQR